MEEVKSLTWIKLTQPVTAAEKMDKCAGKMKESLCRAVASYRYALNLRGGQAQCEDEENLKSERAVARNLLVSLSYLVERVVYSARLAIYVEATEVLAIALNMRGSDPEWRRGVQAKWWGMVSQLRYYLPAELDGAQQLVRAGEKLATELNRWSQVEEERICLGQLRLMLGDMVFLQATIAVAEKDFKVAIQLLEEVSQFGVEEAKALLGGDSAEALYPGAEEMQSDLAVLEASARTNRQLAGALQYLSIGDEQLAKAIDGYEELHLDLIFDVEDQYKFALNLAKGEDVEIVCMVQTKIAKLYLKVYTDGIHKTKAREILTEVMNFAGIIGRNMYEADWYKEATQLLSDLHKAAQTKEDSEWKNKRKVVLESLAPDLKQLEEFAKKDERGLVEALFATFPPKHQPTDNWRQLLPKEGDPESGWKSVFRKLVIIYHPDRVGKEKYGDKYHVLCEEITAELNRRYSCYKC